MSRRRVARWAGSSTALIVALTMALGLGAAAPAWAMSAGHAQRLEKAAARGDHQALARLRQAAAQGDAGAQTGLGLLYYHGQGVPQNYAKAAFWWSKAAAQGIAQAQFNLGFLYDHGQGVPQDYVAAYKWYELAKAGAKPGAPAYNFASKRMKLLAPHMTPAQIAQAQAAAEAWARAHPR